MVKLAHIIDAVQCPRCNSQSKVFNSRDVNQARWRRRRCMKCGHRYSTYEIHAEEYERLQQVDVNKIDAAITVLNTIKTQLGDSNGNSERKV